MKNINIFSLLFALLVFTQCTKSEQFTTQFEGNYIGTFTGEWERTTIKNFKTDPDTVYSSKQLKDENVTLTIKNFDFGITRSNAGDIELPTPISGNTGTFSIKGDSIFFDPWCHDGGDCLIYISGGWQYEFDESGLRLTNSYDGWQQRNATDKEFTKGKSVYELKKVN